MTKFYGKNKFFFNDDETMEKFKKMDDKKLAKYLSKFSSISKKDNK